MKIVLFLAVFLLSACSIAMDQTKPELKLTLIKLTNNYLSGLSQGNFKILQNTIDWEAYQESCRCSIPVVKGQMIAAAKDSPLKDLAVTKITSDKDDAKVYLKGLSGKLLEKEFEVSFHWNGSGWLVSGDNLFGNNGLLSQAENKI